MSIEISDCTIDESFFSFPTDVYQELRLQDYMGRMWTEEKFSDTSGAVSGKIYQLLFEHEEGSPIFEQLSAQLACIGSLQSPNFQKGLYQDIVLFLGENKDSELQVLEGKAIPCGLGKKASKFFKKHKTAIIIGVIIVAVIVVAAVIIFSAGTASGTVAGAATSLGGTAGQALCDNNPTPPLTKQTAKPNSLDPVTPLPLEAPTVNLEPLINHAGSFDEEAVLRSYAMAQAEREAKEQRYPYLAVPAEQIEAAEETNRQAWNKLYDELPRALTPKNINDIHGIAADILTAAASAKSGDAISGVVSTIDLTFKTTDLIKNKIEDFTAINKSHEEALKAYKDLKNLESQNFQASFIKCEQEGYRPNLEFTLDPEGKISIKDSSNPNDHTIKSEVP